LWPNAQPAHDLRNAFKTQPHRRRQLQYEIQKANIFVSQLATRSYFVELYFGLCDVHLSEQQNNNSSSNGMGPQTEAETAADANGDKEILELMSLERELIVQNLLTVLGSNPTVDPSFTRSARSRPHSSTMRQSERVRLRWNPKRYSRG
jgi:hypothetical protein